MSTPLLAGEHEQLSVSSKQLGDDAMAAWFPATPMGERKGTRESIGGNAEARQKPALAAFQGSGFGPHRGVWRGSSDSNYTIRTATKTRPSQHVLMGSVRFADQNATAWIELRVERT
jgi:hypothetical protein